MKRLIIFSVAIIMSLQDALGQASCISCNGSTTSSATGSNAIAIGTGSLSQGAQSVTIGSYDTAFLDLGFCIGSKLRDSGVGAILLGTSNYAIGPNSFIAGTNSAAYGSNTYAIGVNNSAIGTNSFAIGNFAQTSGLKSFAIGNYAITDSIYSFAIGNYVRSSDTSSIVLGSGINSLQPLQNNVSNSLMVGFNSTTPTLYVGPANNHGPTSVGIGTTTPQQMLDVNGNIAVSGIEVINNAGIWVGKPTGSRWYSGTTDPANNFGNDSDFYLNTVTDSVFERLGTWTGIALIKGAPGATTLDTGSVFLGNGATTSGTDAFAIGTGVTANGSGSFVMGSGITNSTPGSFLLGFGATSPLIFAGGVGAAGFVGIGTATATPGVLLGVNGAAMIGGGGAAVGAALTVNGNAAITGTATITGIVNANGGITVGGTEVINASGNAPGIVNDAVEQLKNTNAAGDVTGTYSALTVVKIMGNAVAKGIPANQQVLQWNSGTSQWAPSTLTIPAYKQGTGVKISGDTVYAIVDSPLWNANKLQRNAVATTAPTNQQVLQWNGTTKQWTPSTLTIPTYKPGTGVKISGDTVYAIVDSPIWNANRLQRNAVSTTAPANKQVLQWNGTTKQWTPSTLTIPTYKPGTGVKISGDTVYAIVDSPLWNANRLQRNAVSTTAPANKQVLQWNSTTKQWTPSTLTIPTYKPGTGVKISGDTVYAIVDSPLWNANRLQRNAVSAAAPANKQVLQWNSTTKQWTPSNTGWAIDSLQPDSILMYTTTKANVGIGTTRPKALLQVQGGHSASTDSTFIVDSNGNVAIGTTNIDTPYKLSVRGEIRAMGITVESGWADYVFAPGYTLMPLTQVEDYISANGHLPGVLSAEQIAQHGLDVGKAQKMMMEKIEELTLYMIELKKQNALLTDKLIEIQSKIK